MSYEVTYQEVADGTDRRIQFDDAVVPNEESKNILDVTSITT
jgi:hypothetical protein